MKKAGLIGVGCISEIYLKNFFEVFGDVVLVAVCDLIYERAENAAKKYGIGKIYRTDEELFADPDIDIVLNLTRPYQHFAVTKGALLAGKHVYCEKPLGASLAEGLELVALAKEKGLMICGAPDTFMGAGIQTCRKLLDSGSLGRIIGGRCAMCSHGVETWHPDPDFYFQYGGGPLFDMGPYYITALLNLVGGVKRVYGYAHTAFSERLITSEPHCGEIIKVNTPTHIEGILTFDTEIDISLITSFDVWRTKQTNIEIYTTKGTLFVPDPNCFDGEISFYNGETGKTELYPLEFDYAENSRCLGLADMAKALETGRPCRASYKQTLHVLEIMDKLLESASAGVPMSLDTTFIREAPMNPSLPHGVL